MILRIFSLICILLNLSFAYERDDIMRDYANKEYKTVCLDSADYYKNNGKNEELLSVIGDSCVRSDFLNPLGYIIKNLISTKEARENASYFATILLQKKLVYQFMNDNLDIRNLRLPKTSHVLSVVFENLVKKNYTKDENQKIKIDLEAGKYILLYSTTKDDNTWVIVEEYEDNTLVQKHLYI